MKVRVAGAPGYEDFEGEVIWFGRNVDNVMMWSVRYGPGPLDFQLFEDQYIEDVT